MFKELLRSPDLPRNLMLRDRVSTRIMVGALEALGLEPVGPSFLRVWEAVLATKEGINQVLRSTYKPWLLIVALGRKYMNSPYLGDMIC